MNVEITVPEMGESVTSGIVAAWLKDDGAQVSEGDDLFELETDKATVAVPSTASGVLTRKVEEGAEVEVGSLVAVIDTEAGAPSTADSGEDHEATVTEQESASSRERGAPDSETGSNEPKGTTATPAAEGTVPEGVDLSPSVRRIVETYRLDVRTIRATGPNGRITKEDALAALERKASEMIEAARASGGVREPVVGSGAGGGERQVRKPLSNIRKRIAENLVQSQRNSAHLTTFNDVDMSAVMEMRSTYRNDFETKHGVRLGFMSFFVKAACAALAQFPQANSAIEGDELVTNRFYDIGVAVSTERGLLVPVLRDADRKSFARIESEILSFAVRAKEKKIGLDELSGGTFTITNGGVFGSLLSTPIPTPGQTAILGMHRIEKRPVVVNDEVVIRPMMYLAVTYDHRVMDGREAVSFLVKIKELIEDPRQLLLDM